MEHDRKLERERLFLMYTKQWWKEYLALRPAHSDRLVKIFTEVLTLDLYNHCSDIALLFSFNFQNLVDQSSKCLI